MTKGSLVKVDGRNAVVRYVTEFGAYIRFEDGGDPIWVEDKDIFPRSIKKSYAGEGKNYVD